MKILTLLIKLIIFSLVSLPILLFTLVVIGLPAWVGAYLAMATFGFSFADTARILLFFLVFFGILLLWVNQIGLFAKTCIDKYYKLFLHGDNNNKPV